MTADSSSIVSTTFFERDGFATVPRMLGDAECDRLASLTTALATGLPGTRNLLAHDWCAALARGLRAHPELAAAIPAGHVAVQYTYFEKSLGQNWLVPVHQDLSLPVRRKAEHPALR